MPVRLDSQLSINPKKYRTVDLKIYPPEELPEARVQVPLSKSMINRALMIGALTPGDGASGVPTDVCDDTRAMAAGIAVTNGSVDVGPAGTAMRFLTAYHAAIPGHDVVIDGSERMRCRPIGPLVDALRKLGAQIEYLGKEGFPPLHVTGRQLSGGRLEIDGTVSSQFPSALAMIAPTLDAPLEMQIMGDEPVSMRYLDLTLRMMRDAGAAAERDGDNITIGGEYVPHQFDIEADWSAATFLYEIEAVTSGWLTVEGLRAHSLQADADAATLFGQLGVVTDYEPEDSPGCVELSASPDMTPRLIADMRETPDMAPALIVACCMLRVPFRFSGLESLRLKESDRIAVLCGELSKLGIELDDTQGLGTLAWEGLIMPITELPVFDPHGDHRMAMALAAVGLYVPGIVITNAEVVNKSWPGFWDVLRGVGIGIFDAADESIEPEVVDA